MLSESPVERCRDEVDQLATIFNDWLCATPHATADGNGGFRSDSRLTLATVVEPQLKRLCGLLRTSGQGGIADRIYGAYFETSLAAERMVEAFKTKGTEGMSDTEAWALIGDDGEGNPLTATLNLIGTDLDRVAAAFAAGMSWESEAAEPRRAETDAETLARIESTLKGTKYDYKSLARKLVFEWSKPEGERQSDNEIARETTGESEDSFPKAANMLKYIRDRINSARNGEST